jgi:hypothetical protein
MLCELLYFLAYLFLSHKFLSSLRGHQLLALHGYHLLCTPLKALDQVLENILPLKVYALMNQGAAKSVARRYQLVDLHMVEGFYGFFKCLCITALYRPRYDRLLHLIFVCRFLHLLH